MEILGLQLNKEGDQRDVMHILREGGLESFPAEIVNIFDTKFSFAGHHKLIVLSGSSLTFSEDMTPLDRTRTEIAAYHAIGAAESNTQTTQVVAICYGAQAIANELWPNSVVSTGKWNVGRTLITFTTDIPGVINQGDTFPISVSFKDEIKIPDEYVVARDAKTSRPLAYRYGHIFGILAHPEMPRQIVERVIENRATDLRYNNLNRLVLTEEEESAAYSGVFLNKLLTLACG